MEVREKYINDVIPKILDANRTELRLAVNLPLEEAMQGVEDKMTRLLREAMRKSLDHVEARYKEYAKRFVSLLKEQEQEPEQGQMNSFNRMKRGISTVERHSKSNFKHRTKEVFDRKLASNHRHREAVKKCFKPLIDDLMLHGTDLQDVLFQKGLLSTSEDGSIRERGSRERNVEFLNIICGRLTYEEFNTVFLPALKEDHAPLCLRLVGELDQLEENENHMCTSCRVREHVQVKRLTASLYKSEAINMVQYSDLISAGTSNRAKWDLLLKEKVPSAKIIDSFEGKYPDFYHEFKRHERETLDCFCDSEGDAGDVDAGEGDGYESFDVLDGCYSSSLASSVASTVDGKTDSVEYEDVDIGVLHTNHEDQTGYKMNAHKHGRCLIINNVQFDRHLLRTRDGAEQDGSRLEKTFRTLGFQVDLKTNLSAGQIKTVIDRYSKGTDHSSCDTFVCCLLSHGKSDYIYGSDGVRISVKSITGEFTASRCPTLAGKPKLFFMQVDRGREVMKACVLEGEPERRDLDDRPCSDEETVYVRKEEGLEVIADESDFLLGYCTSPGYVSYRSSLSGSWYIKALCEVLESQADRHDLLSCLTQVNDQVARSSTRDAAHARTQQQVPAPVFTLRKKVYLTVDPEAT